MDWKTAQLEGETFMRDKTVKSGVEASKGPTNRITHHARTLRQAQTSAEEILWDALRNRKMGFKFVRQKPFAVEYYRKRHTFVADFYSRECKLIVEVDGSFHAVRQGYDQLRTSLLKQQHDLQIIRFTNSAIYNNLTDVVQTIKKCLTPLSPLRRRRGETAKPRGEALTRNETAKPKDEAFMA